MLYPEFRSRTPPPTYIASMMEYADHRRRLRSLSYEVADMAPELSVRREAVEMVPNVSRSIAVEPIPATPPPAYPRGHGMVHEMPSVYCPRALRVRPHSFVATDTTRPATSGSASVAVAGAANQSSSELSVVTGKCAQGGVGHVMMAATRSHKPDQQPSVSSVESRSDDEHRVASASSVDS